MPGLPLFPDCIRGTTGPIWPILFTLRQLRIVCDSCSAVTSKATFRRSHHVPHKEHSPIVWHWCSCSTAFSWWPSCDVLLPSLCVTTLMCAATQRLGSSTTCARDWPKRKWESVASCQRLRGSESPNVQGPQQSTCVQLFVCEY